MYKETISYLGASFTHGSKQYVCPESTLPPLAVMKSSIYRLENKIKQLKQNHHDDDIVLIKNKPFITEQVESSVKQIETRILILYL